MAGYLSEHRGRTAGRLRGNSGRWRVARVAGRLATRSAGRRVDEGEPRRFALLAAALSLLRGARDRIDRGDAFADFVRSLLRFDDRRLERRHPQRVQIKVEE